MNHMQFNNDRDHWPDFHIRNSRREKQLRLKRNIAVVLSTTLCLFTVVLFAVDYILQPERFPTKRIDVVGDLVNTSSSQVATAVAAVSASNLLRVDIAKAAQAAQSIPWVEGATIRRKWPDTLEVQVNERVIRARWNEDQFVDQIGIAVSLPDFEDPSLPQLSGPDDATLDLLDAYDLWNESAATIGLEVSAIKLSERGSWEIILNSVAGIGEWQEAVVEPSSIRVILGSSDIQNRSARFVNLYSQVFKPVHDKVAVFDMRYPDGVSVTWKDSPPQMKGSISIANS